MEEVEVSLWDKVNYDLVPRAVSASEDDEAKQRDLAENKKRWRRRRRFLDAAGTLLWGYAVLKLFVFDVEREIVDAVVPGSAWVADYRFYFFLGMLVIYVVFFPKWWALVGLGYLLAFPFIVLGWKAPRAIRRTNSWMALFVTANLVSTFAANLKYVVIMMAFGMFAALMVMAGSSTNVLSAAIGVLVGLLALSLARAVRYSVVPSRFLTSQQTSIRGAVRSDVFRQLTAPADELLSTEVEKFSPSQQSTFLQSLSLGVLSYHGLYYWAHQLNQYRKTPASILFGALSHLWLLLQSALLIAFINYALYKLDPQNFGYSSEPSQLVFIRSALVGLYGGEIDALLPISDLANAISIATLIIGVLVIFTLLVTVMLEYREQRTESTVRETIDQIASEGRRLDDRLKGEYGVSAEEASRRLEALGSNLAAAIAFFTSRIPTDFNGAESPGRGERPDAV